jgi:hypothetical protein
MSEKEKTRSERLKIMEERSRERLRHVQKLASETEISAVESLTELQLQRESLNKSRETNLKTQGVIKEADGILDRMSKWFGIW